MDMLGPSLWDVWNSSNQMYENDLPFVKYYLFSLYLQFMTLLQALGRDGCLYRGGINIYTRTASF